MLDNEKGGIEFERSGQWEVVLPVAGAAYGPLINVVRQMAGLTRAGTPTKGKDLFPIFATIVRPRGDMIKAVNITLTLALAACATTETPSTAVGHQPAEEAAILAVMDAYMHEISANDLAAMDARQTPEGMTYRFVVREDGGWDVVPHPNAYWVAPERADDRTYRERYWSPTVMIRGAMALVWAPYEFQIDGETTHCGVDVFSFAKIDGVWKVSNSMWTVEPSACAELRPEYPDMIRPRD